MENEPIEERPSRPVRDMGWTWTSEGPNILAEDSLERIQQALSEGWVCGIEIDMGSVPDTVAFSTYAAFHSYVANSTAGNELILWSVSTMRKEGFLLVESRYDEAASVRGSLLRPPDEELVNAYLAEAKSNEILCVVSAGDDVLKAFWSDLDSSDWDPLLESAKDAAVPGGVLCVLPFTKIDFPEHYLIRARRPNSEGQVPLLTSY